MWPAMSMGAEALNLLVQPVVLLFCHENTMSQIGAAPPAGIQQSEDIGSGNVGQKADNHLSFYVVREK